MNMGGSLGYTQGLQYNAINIAQPSQSIPRLRQERLEKLRMERIRRQSRQLPRNVTTSSLVNEKLNKLVRSPRIPSESITPVRSSTAAPADWSPGSNRAQAVPQAPKSGLAPAAAPAQDTASIQRVKMGRVSSLISAAFMGSSVLGLVQTFLFTYIFGRYTTGEAYLQAYIIPNLIYTVVAGGALSSAFIPVFTMYADKNKDEKTAWHVASSALNLSTVIMIVLAIVMIFLAPILVPLYSKASEVGLIVTLTRIMLTQAVVLGSGVIVGAILNTKQDFTRTALGTVLYNVGLILGLVPGFFLTLHSQASNPSSVAVYAATWGVVLGAMLQVGVQIPGLFKVDMKYTFVFDWKHPGVRQIVKQMIPRVINAMMLSFSTAVDRYLLSFLSAGILNSYLQAFSIMVMPITLFGSSVSTAAFPTLASYVAKGRLERVRNIIMETLRNILFLIIPSSVGLAVLAFPIAQTLLEHGNFDSVAAQYSSVVLIFFAVGVPAQAAIEILTRSFYALQDSKTPVTISVLQFIVKIALSLVLINLAVFGTQWGMGALALSTSIAATLEALALFILLSQRLEGFELQPFLHFIGRALLASGVMGVALYLLRVILDHLIDTTSMSRLAIGGIFLALFKLLIELGLGSAVFLVAARLLQMEEMNSGLVRRVLNLLRVPWL
jgi:putative peptidoglycan lipid II flippase